jgi:WhiB family transcriptional regulator, redox-sensing transcriptional regulator
MRADWMRRAACAGVDVSVFVDQAAGTDDEPRVPPAAALRWCRACVVAGECLEWALSWPGTVGVYGGTSTAARRQLKRPRARVRCPVCRRPDGVVPLDELTQACVSCGGISWRVAA